MHWARFLTFNAAGGIVWATLYGVGAYLAGAQIEKLSRPLQIGFGILGGIALIASILFVRFHAKRLEAVAEAAHPGPLEGFRE
jgi:membrane protein DedA with SNARE-associated domain